MIKNGKMTLKKKKKKMLLENKNRISTVYINLREIINSKTNQ